MIMMHVLLIVALLVLVVRMSKILHLVAMTIMFVPLVRTVSHRIFFFFTFSTDFCGEDIGCGHNVTELSSEDACQSKYCDSVVGVITIPKQCGKLDECQCVSNVGCQCKEKQSTNCKFIF